MKLANKMTLVLSKVFEIVHWIGAGGSLVLFLFSIFARKEFGSMMLTSITEGGVTLTSYGFEVNFLTKTGDINMIAVTLFFLGGIIGFALMAMIFRNINLIMKTINGKNKRTTSTSPFQEDVIRMVKEIGMFSIAIPVVGFLISVITCAATIISGLGGAEMALNFDGFILGMICLSLTNIFVYGANLEKEVDGLL